SPRCLAESAGRVLGAIDELTSITPAVEQDASLLRLAWRAMATSFEVVFPYGTPDAVPLARAAFARLDELEGQLTVYRDTSEVSRLNRIADRVPVRVEMGLFQLLR